jgi:hypothetical protein
VPQDRSDSSFDDLFYDIRQVDYLTASEEREAKALFDEGFTHHAADYDAAGLSPEAVAAIREEFFDLVGIDESQFDWEGWREAMGYE